MFIMEVNKHAQLIISGLITEIAATLFDDVEVYTRIDEATAVINYFKEITLLTAFLFFPLQLVS